MKKEIVYDGIFLDIPETIKRFPECIWFIFIGARGCGKTYSLLRNSRNGEGFMYSRRTEKQAQKAGTAIASPYKKLNRKLGANVEVSYVDKLGFGNIVEGDKHLGYLTALSTFSNCRGIDFDDVNTLFLDEFIPEPNKPFIKGEYILLKHMYETINRNRELEGEEALKCILASNSTSLRSPILIGFDLIPHIQEMCLKRLEFKEIGNILVCLPLCSDYVKAKAQTALYKGQEDDFSREALLNQFTADSFKNCGKKNLREFLPYVAIDDIYIYKHKSRNEMYACRTKADCPVFTTVDTKRMFLSLYGTKINMIMIMQKMYYYDYAVKLVLEDLF